MLLIATSGFSQNYFETMIGPVDNVFREAQYVVETKDNGFLVTCGAHHLDNPDMIVILNSEGDVLNTFAELIDGKNPKYCTVFHHPDNDDTYLAIAVLSQGHECSIYIQDAIAFLKIDSNLNILSQNIIDLGGDCLKLGYVTGENRNGLPRFIMEDDGTLTMAAHCKKTDGWRYIFARMTASGEIIRMSEEACSEVEHLYDFFAMSETDGGFGLIKHYQSSGAIDGGTHYYYVDTDYNCSMVKRVYGMQMKRFPETAQVPDSAYYIAVDLGKSAPTIYCYNDDVMLMSHTGVFQDHYGTRNCQFLAIVDDSINVGNMKVWQKNPTMNQMSPMLRSMSITEDAIYCCGILHMNRHVRNQYENPKIQSTTIVLAKFDKDLNHLWTRYYEDGNRFYDLNNVVATEDGGCILTGVCSYNDDYYKFITYILKVDADGYDAIYANNEPMVKPYYCYPNPASDQLFVEISPDVQCEEMEIFTLDGRMMKSQNNNFEAIDISNLSAGVYILKVTMADGKEYSERIVKE